MIINNIQSVSGIQLSNTEERLLYSICSWIPNRRHKKARWEPGRKIQRNEKGSLTVEKWRECRGAQRGRETKRRRVSSTREHCSHHVRLYSATMKQALRAVSLSVTFSPSPWFFSISCLAVTNCCWDEGRCLRRLSCLWGNRGLEGHWEEV